MAEVSQGRDGNRVGVPPETLEAVYAHSARLQSVAMMTRATSRILIEEARALRDLIDDSFRARIVPDVVVVVGMVQKSDEKHESASLISASRGLLAGSRGRIEASRDALGHARDLLHSARNLLQRVIATRERRWHRKRR